MMGCVQEGASMCEAACGKTFKCICGIRVQQTCVYIRIEECVMACAGANSSLRWLWARTAAHAARAALQSKAAEEEKERKKAEAERKKAAEEKAAAASEQVGGLVVGGGGCGLDRVVRGCVSACVRAHVCAA